MDRIDELIRYHQESEFLEFKLIEYREEIRVNLIKDILGLANAFYEGDRYLIIGLKKEGNHIKFNSIENPEDAAGIQQFIHQNIFPELNISYAAYKYEGHPLAILIIKNPIDQPYSAIKSLHNKSNLVIRQNEMLIKKGSHQIMMSRRDLDQIYERRYKNTGLDGKIELTFLNKKKEIDIECVSGIELPSQLERKKIEEEIFLRENLLNQSPVEYAMKFGNQREIAISYSQMGLPELRNKFNSIEKMYETEDKYYLYETRSFKLNFQIVNNGDFHLEQPLFEFIVPKVEGLKIMGTIAPTLNQVAIPETHPMYNYPTITCQDDLTLITQELGEVRHHFPTNCFKTSLRIFADQGLQGKNISITAKVFAANLTAPQDYKLVIKFI